MKAARHDQSSASHAYFFTVTGSMTVQPCLLCIVLHQGGLMLTSCSPGTIRMMCVTGKLYIPHPQAVPLPPPLQSFVADLLVIVTDAASQLLCLMRRLQCQLVCRFQT